MNTKNAETPEKRKEQKRAARKKAPAKAKREATVARGSLKKKVKQVTKGQTRKR